MSFAHVTPATRRTFYHDPDIITHAKKVIQRKKKLDTKRRHRPDAWREKKRSPRWWN